MPSQEEGEPRYQVAGLLAFHLVSQVLDEARTIANAASESGRPWLEYLSKRKNTMPDLTYVITPGEETFSNAPIVCPGGVGDEGKDPLADTLVTSTPQKVSDDNSKVEILIGQGDEEVEPYFDIGKVSKTESITLNNNNRIVNQLQKKLNKCTSMYINQLFDMSDVENTFADDSEENNSESIEVLAKTITQMMQSCADKALDRTQVKEERLADNFSRSTVHSSYTFLELDDVGRDYMFFADGEAPSCTDKVENELAQTPTTSQQALQQDAQKQNKIESSELYENSYLTMNRDYDQCSDDDGYPILQDPKGMTMQEIELLTSNTSEDSDASDHEGGDADTKKGGLGATSAVSASSRKSGLVRRCRLQGARLLACLRGWWRRKTPSRRKVQEDRAAGPCGRCPLSPIGRRAATLQCRLSPAPPRVIWRFNTLNEALVNSSIWKDYTFETKPSAFGDI